MTEYLFANNASALLAVGIAPAATVLQVDPGDGALFPSPGVGQQALLAIEDDGGNLEYVMLTSRTGDNLTVVRAQEGTLAQTFAIGARVENRLSAGTLGFIVQKDAVVNQIRGADPADSPITWVANQPQINGSDIFTFADLPTITPYSETLLDDADAPTWRATLGATTVGDAVFVAADAAAARTALALGTSAVENVQAVGTGDLLREDGSGLKLQKSLWPNGAIGCEVTLGTDTDHDFDVAVGYFKGSVDSLGFEVTSAFGKQIDRFIASGGTPAAPTGALGVADEFTNSSDITFTNGTSKITNTTGLFSGVAVGDTVVFRGTTSNNIGFTITAKTSDNDITVSPAPTNESPASCSMQALLRNTFYYIYGVDVGGVLHVGIDDSASAANLLAHLSATDYGELGWLATTIDVSNILFVVGKSAAYYEYNITLNNQTFFKIPWATYYDLFYVGGGAGGNPAKTGGSPGGGAGGAGTVRFAAGEITEAAVQIGAGGGVGTNGGDTKFNGWTAEGGSAGVASNGGAPGRFGKDSALSGSKADLTTVRYGFGGNDNGGAGGASQEGPGGGGGGNITAQVGGLGGRSYELAGHGGNGAGLGAGSAGTPPGGGGGGGTQVSNGLAGAQGALRVRAYRGHTGAL